MVHKKCELILALDLKSDAEVMPFLARMERATPYIKIGPRLFASGGVPFLRSLVGMGYQVFLDIKLHDIPNTVAGAVDYLAGTGLWALTLHTSGGYEMMAAAREARDGQKSTMKLLGVSVLTSLAGKVWEDVHPGCSLDEALLLRARTAASAGLDGLVCSPMDLERLQGEAPQLLRVVPGIRTGKVGKEDQQRVATASQAAQRGADFIVVGRPILEAADPKAAVENILKELEGER